ncbi:hypothetical protein D1Z90_20900, partial [Motilimonas pumila]
MKKCLLAVSISLSFALSACGGGSSSSEETSSETTQPAPTQAPTGQQMANITVIDDYLQDAKVWLDYNQDFIHQA